MPIDGRCLYCREARDDFSTAEHFIPERLGKGHPFVLAPGAVCDQCQRWASSDIDPAAWKEDMAVRQALHWLQIEGKQGRPTCFTGSMGDSYDPVAMAMQLRLEPGGAERPRGNIFWSRSIHRMALGAHAWLTDGTRQHEFDEVARFVRKATKGEFRPFARAVGRWLDDQVGLDVRIDSDKSPIVAIQLHLVTYWVALGIDPLEALRKLDLKPGLHIFLNGRRDAEHIRGRTQLNFGLGSLRVRVGHIPDGDSRPIVVDAREAYQFAVAQEFQMSAPLWRSTGRG